MSLLFYFLFWRIYAYIVLNSFHCYQFYCHPYPFFLGFYRYGLPKKGSSTLWSHHFLNLIDKHICMLFRFSHSFFFLFGSFAGPKSAHQFFRQEMLNFEVRTIYSDWDVTKKLCVYPCVFLFTTQYWIASTNVNMHKLKGCLDGDCYQAKCFQINDQTSLSFVKYFFCHWINSKWTLFLSLLLVRSNKELLLHWIVKNLWHFHYYTLIFLFSLVFFDLSADFKILF